LDTRQHIAYTIVFAHAFCVHNHDAHMTMLHICTLCVWL